MYIWTWYFDEGIPNAGPTSVLVGHAFDLIRRGRRAKGEPLGETISAQLAAIRPANEKEDKKNKERAKWGSHGMERCGAVWESVELETKGTVTVFDLEEELSLFPIEGFWKYQNTFYYTLFFSKF